MRLLNYDDGKVTKASHLAKSSASTLTTQSVGPRTNTLADIFNDIVGWFAAAGCYITGGSWNDSNWQTGVGNACSGQGSYSWVTDALGALGDFFDGLFGGGDGGGGGTGGGGDSGSGGGAGGGGDYGGGAGWVAPNPCDPNYSSNAISKIKVQQVQQDNGGCATSNDPNSPNYQPYPISQYQDAASLAAQYSLSYSQQQWLSNNQGALHTFEDFINNNSSSPDQDKAEFLNFAINYLINNPGVSAFSFQTQFLQNSIDYVLNQGPGYRDQYNKMNDDEKALAWAHPLDSYHVYQNAQYCLQEAHVMFPTLTTHNDDGDAFRHCLWNVMNADLLGASEAKDFANAHESDPNNPPLEKLMDLSNNAIGIRYQAYFVANGITAQSAKEAYIINQIYAGQLFIIENGVIVQSH